MRSVEVKIEGVKETVEKLRTYSQKKQKQISHLVLKSGLRVEAEAKRRAPVRTGALRNSIRSEMEDEFTAVIGAYMPYAIYVEFGTRKMEARPYLRPAVEVVEPEFKKELKAILKEVE